MKKVSIVLIWVISIMFIATGALKFAGMDKMSQEIFGKANYPVWLFYTVAFFEFVGGLMLLFKALRIIGVAMTSIVMIGAIGTHIYLKDNFGHLIAPVVIILLLLFLMKSAKK